MSEGAVNDGPACGRRCVPPCDRCLSAASQVAKGMGPWQLATERRPWWVVTGWTVGCAGLAVGLLTLFPPLAPVVSIGCLLLWGWGWHRAISAAERRMRKGGGGCYACGYRLAGLPDRPAEWLGEPFSIVACPECGRWNGRPHRDAAGDMGRGVLARDLASATESEP